MAVRYTEAGQHDLCGDFFGSPGLIVTVDEPPTSPLGAALVRMICGDGAFVGPLLVTTEGWWTGCSGDATATYEWIGVCVSAPNHDWERRWSSVPALIAALGANA